MVSSHVFETFSNPLLLNVFLNIITSIAYVVKTMVHKEN